MNKALPERHAEDQILITIVTVTLNSAHHVEQTIESVLNQSYENIEYIIIDGGSTDNTNDIIGRYENGITKWISEPDHGIADAMNKSIRLATGKYILFLHSDDYLYENDSIEKAIQSISGVESDIFAFDIIREDAGRSYRAAPRGWNAWMNFKTALLHQGTLCSKDLFDRIGDFDSDFSVTMDYEFFLRAYRAGASVHYIDQPLSVMRLTGISSRRDWKSLAERFKEEQRVHAKHCTGYFLGALYALYWAIYPSFRKLKNHLNFQIRK